MYIILYEHSAYTGCINLTIMFCMCNVLCTHSNELKFFFFEKLRKVFYVVASLEMGIYNNESLHD